MRLTRESRNPIQVDDRQGTATVDCTLSLFLVGEWRCERQGGPVPAVSVALSASARKP